MEKDIIYIAGNPSAYPLEYYDRDARCYQGVIPELLRRFSERSRYDVRYYAPGEGDQRKALAANRQVDIISCSEDIGAVPHRAGEDILLLEDGGDGRAVVLSLLDTAPAGLAGELRGFLSGVSQRELACLVVQAAQNGPPQNRQLFQNIVLGMALAVALLAAALVYAIASSRRRLKRLRREREIDPATGIGNREHLERYWRSYLNDRNRVLYTMFCFCFAPPDAGVEEEDAVPRHIAVILQEYASDTDILARVSDNGFALLRLSPGERDSVEWLTAVLERLRAAWQEGGSRVPKVTAGAYPLKADNRDLNEIVFRGLRAAQAARREGADYRLVSDEALRAIQEERRLRADARSGLQNREFQLCLQFYADAVTGRAAGAEVLVLWDHPEKGLLPASRWLPILEGEGLAAQLDDYVLERMCTFLDFLRQNGREDFFLLYRLSGATLSSGAPEGKWKDVLAGYRFDRGRLLFGVPQDAAAGDGGAVGADAIRSMGMGLVLDGFAGQLAGLAQARDARFCGLKLGKELAGQAETPSGRVALESMFRAGHKLELVFLAEGVDSEGQAGYLRELGCDLLRGERYAHPLPAWEAMKKLVGRKTGEEELIL